MGPCWRQVEIEDMHQGGKPERGRPTERMSTRQPGIERDKTVVLSMAGRSLERSLERARRTSSLATRSPSTKRRAST